MATADASQGHAAHADASRADTLAREASTLRQAGRTDEAIARYRESLALRPDHPPTWLRLGHALREAVRLDEAAQSYREALARDPGYAAASANLGLVLQQQGDLAGAEQALIEATRLAPAMADAHCALGLVRLARGTTTAAIASFTAAIGAKPDYAIAHHNLATALMAERRYAEALDAARAAMRADGTLIEARRLLAQLCELCRQDDEAAAVYDTILAERPDDADSVGARASIAARQCDWPALERWAPVALDSIRCSLAAGRAPSGATPLLSMLLDPSLLGPSAALWSGDIERQALARAPRFHHPATLSARRSLRIGYLSGDFRNHATMHLIGSLFGHHDRARVAVHAYSYGLDDRSPYRRLVEDTVDRFVDLHDKDDSGAAACIHGDGIDILVDLKGHTGENRLAIAALRPAPLQVTWLGFPGPVGARFFDYALVDSVVVPPEHRARYVEGLCYLPHGYQPNGDKQEPEGPPLTRRDVGLDPDAFVFANFNSPYKLLPALFDRWLDILAAVPGSLLWTMAETPVLQRLRDHAGRRGLDPLRIVAAGFEPRAHHLKRLELADLALDPAPINGHTTTSDCLRVGLPVVALAGDSFAARVSASLLATIGLTALIANDLDDYSKRAIALARDPGHLATVRDTLRKNRATSPLFDTHRFAANLETAYETMWQHRCAGFLPRVLEIAERNGNH